MTIVLFGYMGSGKSTIGECLSQVIDYDFIDLDALIEDEMDMEIKDIFKIKGEVFFRKKETEMLSKALKKPSSVIALGGGTPCYGANLDLIKKAPSSTSIYLKASLQHLVERLFNQKSKRPLISHLETKDDLFEFIGKHLFERAPFYEQSDITVQTDDKTVKDIIESILLRLF